MYHRIVAVVQVNWARRRVKIGFAACCVATRRPGRRHGCIANVISGARYRRQLDQQAIQNVEAAILSHGDQKLLDIAITLALAPKVLLLDEPTAGIGPEERWRMIERVRGLWEQRKLALVFI